jgi:hypothetical protein
VRRWATSAVIGLIGAVLAFPSPSFALPVDVSGGFGGFRASAQWVFPPENPRSAQTFAFAEVYQPVTNTNGGVAVVGVGVCVFVHEQDTTRECRGSGFAHDLVPGELELSPTLNTARLDYFERGYGYHVTWDAKDPVPTVTPDWGLSASAVAAGGRISRAAVAEGTVIGLDLNQASAQAATLGRGGSFGAALHPDGDRITFDRIIASGT